MRALLTFLFASVVSIAGAQVGFDRSYFNELSLMERAHHQGGAKSGGVPGRGFDLKYHRLRWQYDPGDSAIAGSVTSRFTTTQLLPAVHFDLASNMIVDSVTNGEGGGPLTWSHNGDTLLVGFDVPLSPGATDSTTVHYHGNPGATGFGSVGWGVHDTLPEVPMMWTLSEPYGAKSWWPCKQDLNDKIDSIDAFVTTPNAYRSAGNGVLVGETDDGTLRTCHWKHRYPIDVYLIATAATNYQVLYDTISVPGGTDVRMATYTWPEESFYADLAVGDLGEQMPLFAQLFGDYPFVNEQYGHARFGWGGGMEHQTMTFLGGWWFELTAHELAHQWFGNKVTCGRWTDLWLNEGFATYLSGLCYDFIAPQYWLGWKQALINSITSAPDGSVYVTDTIDINRLFSSRLTYHKGAMVLHMLRWVCGDSAFFQGVHNYLDDPTLAYGTALTADLVAHLEATSGLDLTEFMEDWFTGEGFPTYTVQWTQDASGNVSVQLDQVCSHPSVGFFDMPVPIRFKNSMIDSTVVFDHTTSGQVFNLNLPFQADSALFDPELWLVSGQNLVLRVPVASFGKEEILLYPNPTNTDEATLYVGTVLQGGVSLRIIDPSGRVVSQQQRIINARRTSIDLRALAPGYYVLDIGGVAYRQPFIKQ